MVTYQRSEYNTQKGSLGLGSDPHLTGHSTEFPLEFTVVKIRGQGVLQGIAYPNLENEEHIEFIGTNPRRES